MKKFIPVVDIKGFAEKQSVKLANKSLEKKEKAAGFLTETGNMFIFIGRTIKETFSSDFEFREFLYQCYLIGNKSLPLVSITGIIMGIVLTIESRPVLVEFGAVSMLPGMVALSLIKEMGPVITALICAGKIGSGMG